MAKDTDKTCLRHYTTKEITEGFPLEKCTGCPNRFYDDDEGAIICTRNMKERKR